VLAIGCAGKPPRPTSTNDDDRVCLPAFDKRLKPKNATDALMLQIFALRPEIKACMQAADPVTPNLQYVLAVTAAGPKVTKVELTRIADGNEVPTAAESCVSAILMALELPTNNRMWALSTIFRYDDCTPKTQIAANHAGGWMIAFERWARANPGKPCPRNLDELAAWSRNAARLDPWGRPYQLICNEREHRVLSIGRDGHVGTADDIAAP
jgi:hypothetical protein